MATHTLAGQPAPAGLLIDVSELQKAYHERRPDPEDPRQRVAFGTSGHRGSSADGTFTEAHVLAITQAVCDYRRSQGIDGPLFLGKDTHALSGPAQRTALEVLAANGVEAVIQRDDGVTPTPVISRAILVHNRTLLARRGDGVVITPSHNPPADGGFKYNPPHGGPAGTDVTSWIQDRANALLRSGNSEVKRVPFAKALRAETTHETDYVTPYVNDLAAVIDTDAIRSAGLKIGIDPLGGAAVHYWGPVADRYGLDVAVTNPAVDPTFRFMTVDHDGKIRMDCSSPYAMAGLVKLKDRFDIAFGNDPDSDRHGIVTRSSGLMNPNHYLAVAVRYLLAHRPGWPAGAAVGKTLVSSGIIDRVVRGLGRSLAEVPVGFKWFVPGLSDGSYCFGGEESAGASFLRLDGTAWTTDKDGLILGLLAAEITARTGKDPGEHYREITAEYGSPCYTRIDSPATPAQKALLLALSPASVKATDLAGEPITAKLTRAPGNGEPIGGLKVTAASGWFAARPSGTEDVYKLYAESFRDRAHLDLIVREARQILDDALASGGTGSEASPPSRGAEAGADLDTTARPTH
jgi:phosphoglucomutase